MFLNSEYFWTNYLDSTELRVPNEDLLKAEDTYSNVGSVEILDHSIKEEQLGEFHYENGNKVRLETIKLSITPASHNYFDGEIENDEDKPNISFCDFCGEDFSTNHNLRMHMQDKHAGPADGDTEEYTIT